VFQYHGCYFHGCSVHCKQDDARELFQKTRQQEEKIKNAGYNLVVVWECKAPDYKDITHEKKIVIYPHAIVYDFEVYLDKAKIYSATKDLTFENVHMPISVSVGDTLNQQPTHLCERDPKALIEKFMNEQQSRASQLRAAVKTQYLSVDFDMLPKKQQQNIQDWCTQVPVLRFNSGKYDLNLIKQYFVEKRQTRAQRLKYHTRLKDNVYHYP